MYAFHLFTYIFVSLEGRQKNGEGEREKRERGWGWGGELVQNSIWVCT